MGKFESDNAIVNNRMLEEKEIIKHIVLQSLLASIVCTIVIVILKQGFHLFKNHSGWDLLLVSVAAGYAYYVISTAWKRLLFSTSMDDKKIINMGIMCIIVSLAMTLIYCIYWKIPAFMHDKARIQFGTFIFSGLSIFSTYTISVWIYYLRRRK